MCGSELSASLPPDGKCPNCGADYYDNKAMEGLQNRAPDPKGKQRNPYTDMRLIVPNTTLADTGLIYDSKLDKFVLIAQKNDDKKEEKEKTSKEEDEKMYVSEEFKQLVGPSDELTENDDNLNIEQTSKDLAIDG